MLKNIARLEVVIENRTYHLTCENDSPLEHLKEVLFQLQKYIGQIEDNVKMQKAAQQAQAEAEKSVETAVDQPTEV